jgi:hypothetical protein
MTSTEISIFDPEIIGPAAVLATVVVVWLKVLASAMKDDDKK